MASEELRRTIARVIAGYDSLDFYELPVNESPNYAIHDQRGYLVMADDILNEIDQAGFSVVNRAALNRAICDLVDAVERRGDMRAEVAWARLDALVPGLNETGPLEPSQYALIDRERWERVTRAAKHWLDWWQEFGSTLSVATAKAGLEPGDLDPPGGARCDRRTS